MVELNVPIITSNNKIFGAVLFEKPGTGEVTLNWYESKLTEEEDIKNEEVLKYP